jgi:hypothetical protein
MVGETLFSPEDRQICSFDTSETIYQTSLCDIVEVFFIITAVRTSNYAEVGGTCRYQWHLQGEDNCCVVECWNMWQWRALECAWASRYMPSVPATGSVTEAFRKQYPAVETFTRHVPASPSVTATEPLGNICLYMRLGKFRQNLSIPPNFGLTSGSNNEVFIEARKFSNVIRKTRLVFSTPFPITLTVFWDKLSWILCFVVTREPLDWFWSNFILETLAYLPCVSEGLSSLQSTNCKSTQHIVTLC